MRTFLLYLMNTAKPMNLLSISLFISTRHAERTQHPQSSLCISISRTVTCKAPKTTKLLQSFEVRMDSGASSSADPFLCFTFRVGGRWVDLKSQLRRRYVGGCKRIVKLEQSRVTLDVLKREVEDICLWQRGYQYELHGLQPGTLPKEYMQLNSEVDVENFLIDARLSGGAEVVVSIPEVHVEASKASSNLPTPTACVDNIQQSDNWDIEYDNAFTVGSRFSNAKAFKQALRSYSIKENCAVKITSSDHSRILAGCCML